jgi:hypothetical protein
MLNVIINWVASDPINELIAVLVVFLAISFIALKIIEAGNVVNHAPKMTADEHYQAYVRGEELDPRD